MVVSINANVGQTIIIAVQVLDGYGGRADGYQYPTIDFILTPSGASSSGYPANMSKTRVGLYRASITLPSGASSVGTYTISVSWPHPDTAIFQYEVFLINAYLPFGNSTVYPA